MARTNPFAQDSNLSWDVVKTPITVGQTVIDSHYALVRDDNQKVLQIHKDSYNPMFNKEFRNLLDEMQKITGFENMKFQEYKEGNVILGYLENNSGESNLKINGFDVDKYLVLGNSHDGSKGIFLGTSEIMLRCMNQFGRIVKNNVIKHTKNNAHKIDELKRAYESYFIELERMTTVYAKLAKVNIDPLLMESLTKRLFDVNENEEISTRKSNQIFDFQTSLVKETKDLGQNGFGFFHGVTHYTTHTLKGENVFGNMFGTANTMNEKALEMVMELI
jgi:hypothetical protein